MYASIRGALSNPSSLHLFEHEGKRLNRNQALKILRYGLDQGYDTTDQFKKNEINELLKTDQ